VNLQYIDGHNPYPNIHSVSYLSSAVTYNIRTHNIPWRRTTKYCAVTKILWRCEDKRTGNGGAHFNRIESLKPTCTLSIARCNIESSTYLYSNSHRTVGLLHRRGAHPLFKTSVKVWIWERCTAYEGRQLEMGLWRLVLFQFSQNKIQTRIIPWIAVWLELNDMAGSKGMMCWTPASVYMLNMTKTSDW
jgi:hypothetical protein